MTASPDKYPQGRFNSKPCRKCGTVFEPQAPSHLYCSQECTDLMFTSNYLRRNYDITVEQYQKMLTEQNSKCKICNKPGFKIKESHKLLLVVDHCHKTGKVRGLLCHNCNRALGLLQDSVTNLENAIQYLIN